MRDTSNSVPGRHLSSRPGRSKLEEDTSNSSRDPPLTGGCHQYKDYFRTSTDTGLPGLPDRLSKDDNTTFPRESQERVSTHDESREHHAKKVGSSHWSVTSTIPAVLIAPLHYRSLQRIQPKTEGEQLWLPMHTASRHKGRPDLMGEGATQSQWMKHSSSTSKFSPHTWCFPIRMGSNKWGLQDGWYVVTGRKESTYQCSRVKAAFLALKTTSQKHSILLQIDNTVATSYCTSTNGVAHTHKCCQIRQRIFGSGVWGGMWQSMPSIFQAGKMLERTGGRQFQVIGDSTHKCSDNFIFHIRSKDPCEIFMNFVQQMRFHNQFIMTVCLAY